MQVTSPLCLPRGGFGFRRGTVQRRKAHSSEFTVLPGRAGPSCSGDLGSSRLTVLSCRERKEHTEGLAAVQSVAADSRELLRSPWVLWGRLTSRQVTSGRAGSHWPTLCLIWTKKGPRLWLIKVLLSKPRLHVWIIFLNKTNLEIAGQSVEKAQIVLTDENLDFPSIIWHQIFVVLKTQNFCVI